MAKSSVFFYGAFVSISLVLTSTGAALACPPCPKGEMCVEACGPSYCQRNKVETIRPDCATAYFTIGSERLRIQRSPDQGVSIERLPDLKSK